MSSVSIEDFETQARIAMEILSKYPDDYILPVNTDKTKALLLHSVVAPLYLVIKYRSTKIKFVIKFRYLGVEIKTKLGRANISTIVSDGKETSIMHSAFSLNTVIIV